MLRQIGKDLKIILMYVRVTEIQEKINFAVQRVQMREEMSQTLQINDLASDDILNIVDFILHVQF